MCMFDKNGMVLVHVWFPTGAADVDLLLMNISQVCYQELDQDVHIDSLRVVIAEFLIYI